MQPRPFKRTSPSITVGKGTLMSKVAVRPPAGRARLANHFPRCKSKGIVEVSVDGRVIEAAVTVGAAATEVVLVAEFLLGDAGSEGAV